MIIVGWTTKNTFEGTASIECPRCRSVQLCTQSKSQRWFTFFFIPIFPISSRKKWYDCHRCQTSFAVQPLARQPEQPAIGDLTDPTQDGSRQRIGPTYSNLSLASIVFGLLSPLLIVFCFTSVISSLIAIVCGHKALSKIKTSRGALSGRGSALAGLSIGYASLALTLLIAGIFFTNVVRKSTIGQDALEQAIALNTAEGRLRNAEAIVRAKSTVGTGNTAEASKIALEIATTIQAMYAAAAAQTGETLGSDDSFRVYCEIHPGTCAIITYVPGYRGYSTKEKKDLADVFWRLSRSVVAGKLKSGDRIAVGLKGKYLYGDVMLGTYGGRTRNESYSIGQDDDLLAFFEPEPIAVPSAPSTGLIASANNIPSNNVASVPASPAPTSSAPTSPAPAAPAKRDMLVPASVTPKVTPFEDLQGSPVAVSTKPKPLSPDDPFFSSDDVTNPPDAAKDSAPPSPQPATPLQADPNFINKLALEPHAEFASQESLIKTITFLNDDKWLVAGGLGRALTTYDISSGKQLWSSRGVDGLMSADSINSNSKGDAVFLSDRTGSSIAMKVNQDGSLEKTQTLFHHSFSLTVVCASPIHPFVATGGRSGNVVWQPYSGEDTQRSMTALTQPVQAIYLPIKGSQAMATDGNTLVKFSLKDGSIVNKLQFETSSIASARFNRDGTRVLLSHRGALSEYDTRQGKLLRTFRFPTPSIEDFGYHPSQAWVTASDGGKLVLWDAVTTDKLASFDFPHGHWRATFASVPDSNLVACCPTRQMGNIQLYRIVPASK